jgi:hypothetical protein
MFHLEVDPLMIASVWAMVFLIRARIPAGLINLDGVGRMWGLVLVASTVVYAQSLNGVYPDDITSGLVDALNVLVLAGAAIVADGGAKMSGLSETLRKYVTIGVKSNQP